jgi:Fe-S oxidoreductase
MAHSKPYVSKEAFQEPLGYPGELLDNWKEVAIDKMGELLGKYRGLQVFLDSCVKCGACTDKCHYFLGTADPKNMPVARQDLLRKVYRRYFTFAGKYFPNWSAQSTQQGSAGRLVQLFPSVFTVPPLLGVLPLRHRHRGNLDGRARDHGRVGQGQKYCNEIIGKVYKIGNNLGLPAALRCSTRSKASRKTSRTTTGWTCATRSMKKAPTSSW